MTNTLERSHVGTLPPRPLGVVRSWWEERSRNEKVALSVVGGALILGTGGAVAYAVAAHGLLVSTAGGTVVALGKVAAKTAGRLGAR